jgi:nucleoside-diphosphate-sugar epimerase
VKAVITGAAGNLGRKLAAHWADRSRQVLLDRAAGPGLHAADLSRWNDDWPNRFDGADVVVHLAGNPVEYHEWPDLVGPKVDAMLNVYEVAARSGLVRFNFASSNHVMGGHQEGPPTPITESLPPKPGLRYFADGEERFSGACAATKLFGERVGKRCAESSRSIEVVAVRLGWVWRGNNVPAELPRERGSGSAASGFRTATSCT